MKAAALLALLAALPAHAGDAVTPAQARANVVQALPPDIAKGAASGDLRAYLERLSPEQKQAALRSLTAKEGELGRDPATLGVIGQAYAGLGKVKETRQAAEAALRQNPNDPQARQLMGWVVSQEKLQGRDGGGGGAFTPASGPGGGGAGTSSAQATLNALEQRIQSVFRRGQGSAEFKNTMADAHGMSVAELNAAGISFQKAPASQEDAVSITEQNGRFTISIRDDALSTRGDSEARGAANVANGVRQAQTKRDHPYIGAALIWARGWWTGAQVHKELAPTDLDPRPTTPSDQQLMVARKLLDQKTAPFNPDVESYGTTPNKYLPMMNNFSKILPSDKLFERYATSTRGGS